jgi:hypothetical protein
VLKVPSPSRVELHPGCPQPPGDEPHPISNFIICQASGEEPVPGSLYMLPAIGT